MEFGRVKDPDMDTDVIIPCKNTGISHQIQANAIPYMMTPFAMELEYPVLCLSKNLIRDSDSVLKTMNAPILLDLFHSKISEINEPLNKCPKCSAYIPSPGPCPFCTSSTISNCYLSWPNKHQTEEIFVFLVIGNTSELFYQGLKNFRHKVLLMRYEEQFICYKLEGKLFREFRIVDACTLPFSAIMKGTEDIEFPRFSDSVMRKADLKSIISTLFSMLPEGDCQFHVVVFNSVPHTCIEDLPSRRNTTVSVLTSNTPQCSCKQICEQTGGHFLPHCYSLNLPRLTTVTSHSIRFGQELREQNESSLLFPGTFLVQHELPIRMKGAIGVQVLVETRDRTFCFSFTMRSELGIKQLMYSMSTQCLLLTDDPMKFFTRMMTYNSHIPGGLCIPHSLRYFLLFPRYSPGRRTIPSVVSTRPFVVQFQPTLRVIDIISSSICSTISILLVFYQSTIYVWVGGNVKPEEWMRELGVTNNGESVSFEIVDMPEDFTSNLWTCIRSIRHLMEPYKVPVVVVPSESGRRTLVMDILRCDRNAQDMILMKKYADLAKACL